MSVRAFCTEQSGASRGVVIGAGAGLALAAAAIVTWLNFAPQPEEPTAITPEPEETAQEPVAATGPETVEEPAEAAPVSEPTETTETTADTPPQSLSAERDAETAVDSGATPDSGPEVAESIQEPTVPETPAEQDAPPVFDVVRVDESGDAVIAGRAGAGHQVRVLMDGVSVAETSADASGAFVALVSLDPSEDPRTLTLESVKEGSEPVVSEETALVAPFAGEPEAPSVETAALETPTEPALPDSVADAPAAAAPAPARTETPEVPEAPEAAPAPVPQELPELQPSPTAPPQVVIVAPEGAVPQSPAAAPARPDAPDTPNVVIDTISYDEEGEVILVGRAQAGNFVRLYLDNILTETVPVSPEGQWRSRVTGIEAGVYTLRADETGESGRVVSRFETPFERVTRPRAIAAAEQSAEAELAMAQAAEEGEGNEMRASAGVVTVQPGFTLWAIARENYGDGVQYVRVFEANQSLIRNPDLIYPGQVFSIPEP